MASQLEHDAKKLCYLSALLFFLAAVTGLLVSAAFTKKVTANPHYMLASHLNALMGCFWLLGVAFTLKWVRLGGQTLALLLITSVVAAYANWLVTLFKSFMDVPGIDFVGDTRNDFIFIVLTITVVVPTFISAWLWLVGLKNGLRYG